MSQERRPERTGLGWVSRVRRVLTGRPSLSADEVKVRAVESARRGLARGSVVQVPSAEGRTVSKASRDIVADALYKQRNIIDSAVAGSYEPSAGESRETTRPGIDPSHLNPSSIDWATLPKRSYYPMYIQQRDPHPGRCQNLRQVGTNGALHYERCLDYEGTQHVCRFPPPPAPHPPSSWMSGSITTFTQTEPKPWVCPDDGGELV